MSGDLCVSKALQLKIRMQCVEYLVMNCMPSSLPPTQIIEELRSNGVEIYQFPTDDDTVAGINAKMNVSKGRSVREVGEGREECERGRVREEGVCERKRAGVCVREEWGVCEGGMGSVLVCEGAGREECVRDWH